MKNFIMIFSFALLILVGCSDGESELAGKKLGLTNYDPTITEEEKKDKEVIFNSHMAVFDFETDDEVVLEYLGNEYQGHYTLDDDRLAIELKDGGTSLAMTFIQFEKNDADYYSYSGESDEVKLDEGGEVSQLKNVYESYMGVNESYIFIEESETD
ncbi:hypothetical protein ACFPFV_07170 [Salinicoccus siamensis]|uniref:Lipoprotein n=1 Tax=Salinicoccus siamensis TaxID=381830 RepID=A0ABV5Z438_9STAP